MHGPVDQSLQQHRRAEIVGPDIAVDFVHALTDADLGREVKHARDIFQRPSHRPRVANVGAYQFDPIRQRRNGTPVNLLDYVIQHPDAVARLAEFGAEMPHDEPEPSEIVRANVRSPVNNAPLVIRLPLAKYSLYTTTT